MLVIIIPQVANPANITNFKEGRNNKKPAPFLRIFIIRDFMRRKYILSIICFILIFGGVLMCITVKVGMNKDLLRTYTESQYGRVEHGAIVITKDGKYRIEKNVENQLCFNMYYDVSLEYEILKNVSAHRKKGKRYYIKSDEGCAVVDIKNEISRVFITVPKNEFVKYSGSVDEKGEKIYCSCFVEDQHIVYLSSYDDFSTQERNIFKKMLK